MMVTGLNLYWQGTNTKLVYTVGVAQYVSVQGSIYLGEVYTVGQFFFNLS